MGKCSCTGSTCGCKVVAGSGATVTGIGTTDSPYSIEFDPTAVAVGSRIATDDSLTVRLRKTGDGDGSVGNPIVLKADVVIASPNGTLYTLRVSNSGALSAAVLV